MNTSIKTSLLATTVTLGLLFASCSNSNSNQHHTSDATEQQQADTKGVYACPMHPEVTGKQGDKCSKCGMDLELVQKDNSENTDVKLAFTPQTIEAGKPTQLSVAITEDGKNVALDVVHEKKIHMLVVNEELTWFDHIHPTEQANGNHTITATFPYSGKYIIYTDFKASNSSATVNKQEIEVAGNITAKPDATKNKWVSKADGYTVTLVNGNDFKTNRPQHMGISIEKDGKFITGKDIQQYLGAVAHVVVIGKSDKDFLHIHPTSNEKFPIHGETRFEKAGVYRMWVQFQLDGKVHTADFTVNVAEGKEVIESEPHDHSGHKH